MHEIILVIVGIIFGTNLIFFPDKWSGTYIENPIWSKENTEKSKLIGGIGFYVLSLIILLDYLDIL